MSSTGKVIITVALNGGMQQDREGTIVPKQPDELAQAALECWQLGAAMVHVHARGKDGKASTDPAVYSEIIRQIRAKCPILIQTTNGIGVRRNPETGDFVWPSDKERLGLLGLEPRQDLFGIAAGSADFHNPEGGYPKETPYVNSPELLRETIQRVYAMGTALEYEVVEASSLHRLMRYAKEGLFDPGRRNIWLLHGGGFGSTPPIPRNVIFSIDEGLRLFPQAIWGVTGTGRDLFPARNNQEMVQEIVKIAALFGRTPATVDEARTRFHTV